MKAMINFILISIISLILAGCTKSGTPPERTATSTFPLTTDSRWHYQAYMYDVPFNDPSLANTVRRDIIRYVIGPDTLLNLPELVAVEDTIINESRIVIDTLIIRRWQGIDEQRLKEYAYSFVVDSDPDPYLYDIPHIILDFPLSAGKEWIAYSWDFGVANSAVVGAERIDVEYGSFICDVLLTRVINGFEQDADTLSVTYEWFSNDGLIRKEIDYGIREILDKGGTVLDSARIIETWELIDMEIQNDG